MKPAVVLQDVRAGGSIAVSVFQGARYHRVDYMREIEPLLRYHSARFVGREPPLEALVEHLKRGAGYLMLRAPAARGKTALLARLVDEMSGKMPLVAHFLRPEAGQHTSTAFLQSINSQLLNVLGVGGGVAPTLMELRPQFSELWSLAARSPLALVVDGLDEMAHEELRAVQLLPAGLGAARVAVSTRPLPDPRTVLPTEHPLRAAQVLDLAPLDLEETRRLLIGLDPAPDELPERVRQVHMIANGEPLVARFVAERVAAHGDAALVDAAGAPHASVDDYFQYQVSVLRDEAPEAAWDLLGVLSVVAAPIAPEDVALLTGKSKRSVLSGRRHVDRYLIPAGQGEVAIGHPALQQQLATEFSATELDAHRRSLHVWAQSFRDVGWPDDTPSWLVLNWPKQLAKDNPGALPELIDTSWLTVRMAADEDVSRGFLADAEAALAVADTDASLLRLALLIATVGDLDERAPLDAVEVMTFAGQEGLPRRLLGAAPAGSIRRAELLARIGRARLNRGDDIAAEAAFLEAAAPTTRFAVSPDDYAAVFIIAENAGPGALRQLADSVFDGSLGDGFNERPEVVEKVLTGLARVGEHDQATSRLREWPNLPGGALLWGILGDFSRLEELESKAFAEVPEWLSDVLEDLPAWFRQDDNRALDLSALAQGWANAGRLDRAADVAARISARNSDSIRSSLLLTDPSLKQVRVEMAVQGLAALEGEGFARGRIREEGVLGRALAPLGDVSLLERAEAIADAAGLDTDVCLGWVEAGEVDRGLTLLEEEMRRDVHTAWLRREVILATLRQSTRRGAADRGELVARSIKDPLLRSHAVAAVALGVVNQDETRGVQLALESIRLNLEMRPNALTSEIMQLATAVAYLTPTSPACAHLAERFLKTRPGRPGFGRATLAELLVAIGSLGDARDLVMPATPSAWGHEDRSHALSLLARAYAEGGDSRLAIEAAKAAEAELRDYRWDSPVWIELAGTWRLVGRGTSSARCLDMALQASARIAEEDYWDEWTPIVDLVDEALAQSRRADATNAVDQLLVKGWPSTVAAAGLLGDDGLGRDGARHVVGRLQDEDLGMEWVPSGVHHVPTVLRALEPADASTLREVLIRRVNSDPDPRRGACLRLFAAYASLETEPDIAAEAAVRAVVDSRVAGASAYLAMARQAVPLLAETRPGLIESHLYAVYDLRLWWSDWP